MVEIISLKTPTKQPLPLKAINKNQLSTTNEKRLMNLMQTILNTTLVAFNFLTPFCLVHCNCITAIELLSVVSLNQWTNSLSIYSNQPTQSLVAQAVELIWITTMKPLKKDLNVFFVDDKVYMNSTTKIKEMELS